MIPENIRSSILKFKWIVKVKHNFSNTQTRSGIVSGSLVLVGGDPGIGKSTILLQMCRNMSEMGQKILYVSGEESLSQIKMRAERIGRFTKDMLLLCVNNLEDVEEYVKKDTPKIIVIDSIQTIVTDDIESAPGSVSQVKEVTARLMRMAKQEILLERRFT